MYEYKPPRGKRAGTAILLLFIASVISFGGASLVHHSPFFLQALGLILLFPAIRFAGKYLFVQYLYRLRPMEDGTVDFEIFAYRGGSRMQLVAKVGLHEIVEIRTLDAWRKGEKRGKTYRYLPDLNPPHTLVLHVEQAGRTFEVMCTPDDKMKEIFYAAVKAKEQP